jgi:hypothetical protein
VFLVRSSRGSLYCRPKGASGAPLGSRRDTETASRWHDTRVPPFILPSSLSFLCWKYLDKSGHGLSQLRRPRKGVAVVIVRASLKDFVEMPSMYTLGCPFDIGRMRLSPALSQYFYVSFHPRPRRVYLVEKRSFVTSI